MFDDIVRLSALQMIFEKPHIRLNPPEAGKVLACFVRLAGRVAMTFDSYPNNPGWRRVHAALSSDWFHIVAESNANEDDRGYMHNIDLRRTIRRLWKLTRYHHRHSRRFGDELCVHVATLIMVFGMRLLGVVSSDDPRLTDLLLELDQQLPLARAITAWREEREERANQLEAIKIAQFVPVSDISEPCANTETQCNICMEGMVDGVRVKACGHLFCAECLEAWMHKGEGATDRCPMCRAFLVMNPS